MAGGVPRAAFQAFPQARPRECTLQHCCCTLPFVHVELIQARVIHDGRVGPLKRKALWRSIVTCIQAGRQAFDRHRRTTCLKARSMHKLAACCF